MKHQESSYKFRMTSRIALLAVGLIALSAMRADPLRAQSLLRAVTQPANTIRATSALLNGMVLPGITPATAWFEWGTSLQYGNKAGLTSVPAGSSVVALRTALTGLTTDYVYHFRLVANNNSGRIDGADQQFSPGGTVVVWGNSGFGQTSVPADLTNAVAIGGGGYHCAALRNDGTITAWGGNAYGQTDTPADLTNAVAIAVGQVHNLALLPDGTVRAWGAGTTLGPDFPEGGQSIVPAGLSNVVQIAAGTTHSLALKADGTVVAWGSARMFIDAWTPLGQSEVPAGLSNVVALSGGDFHNMALKADGTVVVWGDTTHGQGVPPGLNGVVNISAGWYHNLALKADRTLIAWGFDPSGEVSGLPAVLGNVARMAGGGFHSLALQADGAATGWGDDSAGQIDVPGSVQNTTVAIAAGYDFSLALLSAAPIEVSLAILPIGDQVRLTWVGGVLQSARELNGTFADLSGAASPLTISRSEAQQFYRIRIQR